MMIIKRKTNLTNTVISVLLCIFKYLDDLSLCSVSMVCRQWRNLLKAHVPDHIWSVYITRRWPLYKSLINDEDKLMVNIILFLVQILIFFLNLSFYFRHTNRS